jgi:hypothetical protein
MQQSLAHSFNETAAAAYAAFPKELKRLVVVLGRPVFISPKVAGKLTKDTAAIREALAEIKSEMYDTHVALDGENITASARLTKRMKALYALDHEIGHHILKNGFPALFDGSGHLAESAADVFATLRHIQRFGKNTGLAENSRNRAAAAAVLFADTDHYTTDAVERALKFADEMGEGFFKLSLRETAEHAAKIADECALDNKTLKRISDAFQPVATYCAAHIGDAWEISAKLNAEDKEAYAIFCRQTLAVMKKYHNDPAVVKAGERFLSRPSIQNFMAATPATKRDRKLRLTC